jgi:preprotein translocase subunit SecE
LLELCESIRSVLVFVFAFALALFCVGGYFKNVERMIEDLGWVL